MADTAAEATPKPALVQITDASDADLDAYIKNPVGGVDPEEASTADDAGEEPTVEAATEGTVPEESPDFTPEKEEEAAPKDANPEADEAKPDPQKEIERLQEQVTQQETFIQKRNSQFGDMRKKLGEIKAGLEAKLEEKATTDPLGMAKDLRTIERIDQEIENLDSQQETMNRVHETQKVVLGHINTKEVSFADMVSTLKADGINSEWVQNFEKNPYAQKTSTGDFIIQLNKRVYAENLARRLAQAYKKLAASGNGAVKQTASTDQVLKNVERAIKSGPSVTAASGAAASKEAYDIDPTKMSDKELDELNDRLNGKGRKR